MWSDLTDKHTNYLEINQGSKNGEMPLFFAKNELVRCFRNQKQLI